MKVYDIARNVDRNDLAPVQFAIDPAKVTLKQQAAAGRTIAFLVEVLMRAIVGDREWHSAKQLDIIRCQLGDAGQMTDEFV